MQHFIEKKLRLPRSCHSSRLLDSRLGMQKGTGKPLGNAHRLLNSLWGILKGFGKLLGNAQIKLIPTGKMYILAGCDDRSGK